MSIRLYIGLFLLKISYYLRRLFVAVLTPRDLIENNKLQYKRKSVVNRFASQDFNLTDEEKEILDKHIKKPGKFLVLGCGGGRESIALAGLGFKVTGVDFVEEMIDCAKRNAGQANLNINFEVADITKLNFPEASFDYASLLYCIYGTIPSRNLRIEILKQLKLILKSGGFFIFNFFIKNSSNSKYRSKILKAIGVITFGNMGYQPGDELSEGDEFMHFFRDDEELRQEIGEAGLKLEEIVAGGNPALFYAVVRS